MSSSSAKGASTSKQSKLLLGAVKKRTATKANHEEPKKAKVDEEKRVGGLGALAGLGEYSSSEEEES